MTNAVFVYLAHEVRAYSRSGFSLTLPLAFSLCSLMLISTGLADDERILSLAGGHLIWLIFFLASLLSFERIIQPDLEDGTLGWLIQGRLSFEGLCFVKALSHWLCTQLPLIAAAPVFAVMLNMNLETTATLILSLISGVWPLSFWGTFCACLTARLPRAGFLLALLVAPLVFPSLVFGSLAIAGDFRTFAILGALSLVSILAAPLAGARTLRAIFEGDDNEDLRQ